MTIPSRAQLVYAAIGAVLGAALVLLLRPTRVEYREAEAVAREVTLTKSIVGQTRMAVRQSTKVRTEERPDGTRVTERTETKLDSKAVATAQAGARSESRVETRTVERLVRPRWRVAALVGTSVSSGLPLRPVYGAEVDYRVLGPFAVGAWGLSTGAIGGSLGVSW